MEAWRKQRATLPKRVKVVGSVGDWESGSAL